jgi:predicted Holliday junction resolvase-like endonuclease
LPFYPDWIIIVRHQHEENMNRKKKAQQLIAAIESGGFYCECPVCERTMRLRDAGLFYLDDFTPEAAERYRQLLEEVKERRKALNELRRSIPVKSQKGAEAVNIGFILERIAPSMKSFAFDHNDCRSLFDPIDYVIFEGLNRKGVVERIVFADIKTGKARLQNKQREIKDLVERNKVEFDTYAPRRKS